MFYISNIRLEEIIRNIRDTTDAGAHLWIRSSDQGQISDHGPYQKQHAFVRGWIEALTLVLCAVEAEQTSGYSTEPLPKPYAQMQEDEIQQIRQQINKAIEMLNEIEKKVINII